MKRYGEYLTTLFLLYEVHLEPQSILLGAFAKLPKATISFVMPVRQHGKVRLPLVISS
jgi:hypothetical protein